jgi:hypothetical protein
MEAWKLLIGSDIGLLSLFTIGFVRSDGHSIWYGYARKHMPQKTPVTRSRRYLTARLPGSAKCGKSSGCCGPRFWSPESPKELFFTVFDPQELYLFGEPVHFSKICNLFNRFLRLLGSLCSVQPDDMFSPAQRGRGQQGCGRPPAPGRQHRQLGPPVSARWLDPPDCLRCGCRVGAGLTIPAEGAVATLYR